MALISCTSCLSDDDIHLEAPGADGARVLRCGLCGHTWSPAPAGRAVASTRTPFDMAKGRFARATMVAPERNARVTRLRTAFLKAAAEPDPAVAEHRTRYQELFSPAGLASCSPQDLRDFATSRVDGIPGSTAVLTRAWNRLGDDESAARIRASISHLLHGPSSTPLEDRLTDLLDDADGTGMPGFAEAQLTRVLCVVEPARFLPILTYGTEATGKRDVVLDVFGLHLPRVPDAVSMTTGRLAVWSNDLLLELAGGGFADAGQAASFLTHAQQRLGRSALAVVR